VIIGAGANHALGSTGGKRTTSFVMENTPLPNHVDPSCGGAPDSAGLVNLPFCSGVPRVFNEEFDIMNPYAAFHHCYASAAQASSSRGRSSTSTSKAAPTTGCPSPMSRGAPSWGQTPTSPSGRSAAAPRCC
jgi:hypothetical protein